MMGSDWHKVDTKWDDGTTSSEHFDSKEDAENSANAWRDAGHESGMEKTDGPSLDPDANQAFSVQGQREVDDITPEGYYDEMDKDADLEIEKDGAD